MRAATAELEPQRGGGLWRRQLGRREPVDAVLAEQLADSPGGGAFVVGTIDDVVVGYGISRFEVLADEELLSVVTDLYVDPSARGIGIGEGMMDMLVEHATEAGATGIDSIALPGDRATKNFFETFGLKARAIIVHRSLRDDGDQPA